MFDENDVVSSYTTDQAIADGVLVHPFPDKFPYLLFTASIHTAIEELDDGRTYAQKAIPFMRDAVMIVQAGLKKDPNEYFWTKGLEGNVTGGDVWMELNGEGGLTLMRPEDR